MSDPVARRIASSALAIALVALVLAAWSAHRTESELHDLRLAVERAVRAPSVPSLGPPPSFDTED